MTCPLAMSCYVFGVVFFLPAAAFAGEAEEARVVVIEGAIIDEATKKPIEGAVVSSDLDVSPVQSGDQGRFQFIVLSGHPFTIRVSKQGYGPFEKLLTPQDKVTLDVRLRKQGVQISFGEFRTGRYIRGRVDGLRPDELSKYKIAVYVLTDKWYIHPFAVNEPGRGYATIGEDGSWSISTVFRGYQAYKVAFLLTPIHQFTPSTANAAKPEQDLVAAVPHRAILTIDAPRGI